MSEKVSVSGYKFLVWIAVLNVAFQLISDATAGKIISVLGVGVSITVIYFPVTYIISDIITEVYGYAKARTVLWMTMTASILAGLIYQLVIIIPPAPFFDANEAYSTVFGIVPRVLLGGWLAVFAGDISNNFVLAKMKIITKGRWLWTRTISSTIVGQGINTFIFYIVALSGILPMAVLMEAILMGWGLKVILEIVLTPVTYIVINKLKKIEGVDYYDRRTNFNPFILGPTK